ncbi:hypothetical protein BLA60_37630 [Actinophytocola xinjiangensis]|uniref:Uncharacterized protein n=1 Tax=Actinophytocola xinjiangensis TaxID=485602 RepID=A0A7Z0WEJ6_9PSEU|nr:hypothetical protein [Actinophytocola xinjiangensis]OLF05104.1 hypothetical protein BLA60_37630 [Actinophytocola xinjiangensis]
MDKRLFDEAMGDVPPATFDVDGLVTRGRRAVRLRRLTSPATATGAAVVVVTGVVALTLTGNDGGPATGVGSAPPKITTGPSQSSRPSQPSNPTPAPPALCSRPNLETPAQLMPRLRGAVQQALIAQRPSLGVSPHPKAEYPTGVRHEALEFYQVTGDVQVAEPICSGDGYFMTMSTTSVPVEGEGTLTVIVQPDFYADLPPGDCESTTVTPEQTSCELVTTPDGDTVLRTTARMPGGVRQNRVDIDRADGTAVMVTVEDSTGGIKPGGSPTASALPLTLDQLTAIGTAPGMTLFP